MHSYIKILKTDKIDFQFVEKITKIFKDEKNLEDYEFEIVDQTINLNVITPWVKENLGSRYCMAHLEALKIVKKKCKTK